MVKIRFSRQGKKKHPFYAIVVTDIRKPRDSGYIDKLGTYNPFSKELKVDESMLKDRLSKGAILTESVAKALKKTGIQDSYTRFAVIIGAHGIKGELKAVPRTDTPAHYRSVRRVFVKEPDKDAVGYDTEQVRYLDHSDTFIVRLKNLEDRTAAEKLKGADLLIEDADLPQKAADEVYIHDLMGCRVIGTDGNNYGTVFNYFENGVYGTVEAEKDGEVVIIPLAGDTVKAYRTDAKEILIDPPAGLIELNRTENQ
ncbi:hypothetical protein CHS0354_018371 [Potamilus streckersoni]|uniref:Small ribosomal subunit protein bS16m n=1 Tax=Potamilus streckersoni TaxID=2493646 RepID=A0AAE0TA99_9BIVA|nr:hypothetical protein CHS0354_018371 [Potamilus streckersoni]